MQDDDAFTRLQREGLIDENGHSAKDKIRMAKEPNPNNITQLVPTKSDADLANELKEKVAEAYKPFLELLNEYDKYGLNVQAGVGKNAFGKYTIIQLQVIKVY